MVSQPEMIPNWKELTVRFGTENQIERESRSLLSKSVHDVDFLHLLLGGSKIEAGGLHGSGAGGKV